MWNSLVDEPGGCVVRAPPSSGRRDRRVRCSSSRCASHSAQLIRRSVTISSKLSIRSALSLPAATLHRLRTAARTRIPPAARGATANARPRPQATPAGRAAARFAPGPTTTRCVPRTRAATPQSARRETSATPARHDQRENARLHPCRSQLLYRPTETTLAQHARRDECLASPSRQRLDRWAEWSRRSSRRRNGEDSWQRRVP